MVLKLANQPRLKGVSLEVGIGGGIASRGVALTSEADIAFDELLVREDPVEAIKRSFRCCDRPPTPERSRDDGALAEPLGPCRRMSLLMRPARTKLLSRR